LLNEEEVDISLLLRRQPLVQATGQAGNDAMRCAEAPKRPRPKRSGAEAQRGAHKK